MGGGLRRDTPLWEDGHAGLGFYSSLEKMRNKVTLVFSVRSLSRGCDPLRYPCLPWGVRTLEVFLND